jgi:predicted metalloprotease with PDZ domain
VTEYFAEHFQVQQNIISQVEYFDKVAFKIFVASHFNDSLSFTDLSKHILEKPYSDNFVNVYFKGPLIAMCLDLLIREESNGERNIRTVVQELSTKYGPSSYFMDNEFIHELTNMNYPSVGDFLNTHVVKGIPIDYQVFMDKVGVEIIWKDEGIKLLVRKNASTQQIRRMQNWMTH